MILMVRGHYPQSGREHNTRTGEMLSGGERRIVVAWRQTGAAAAAERGNNVRVDGVIEREFGRPTEKQAQFLRAKTRYVGYGGAKGGGKSHAIRYKATLLALAHRGIQILIVRRTLPELRENHTKRLRAVYGEFPKLIRPRYSTTEKAFTFPGGSRIKLGYCAAERDVLQYQGQEYDVLFVDEATQLSEYQFYWLDACVRGAGRFPKRTYITCNPGGVGHAWVKRLFIDRDMRRCEQTGDYTFIQARVWDNAPLFEADAGYIKALAELKAQGDIEKSEMVQRAREQADYVRQLSSLPENLRRAWLDGDWDVFAGQFFGEFCEDVHVMAPFDIPDGWRKSAALDYGLDMLAVLWFAVAPSGRAYCYRSIERPNLTVSDAAKAVLAAGSEDVCEVIAPPDLWNRRQDSGRSAADIFAENGVALVRAGNKRADGWLNVKEYLKPGKGGPKLMFFSTCAPIIRCLPLLQHDPKKPGDAATQPHEVTHSPDALRYWCSRRQMAPEANAPQPADPFGSRRREEDGEVAEAYLIGGFGV